MTLVMLAFTSDKFMLSAIQLDERHSLSNVKIHVEGVIGLIRNKYGL